MDRPVSNKKRFRVKSTSQIAKGEVFAKSDRDVDGNGNSDYDHACRAIGLRFNRAFELKLAFGYSPSSRFNRSGQS
nr:hypothetical protein [Tanacetum cinerariifolium]